MVDQPYPRIFTVDEANRLLPELRSLMERIFDALVELRKKGEEKKREGAASTESRPAGFSDDDEIRALTFRIREAVEQIQKRGCMCKGLEQGLVDFPCFLNGEIVFLCWRYGEEGVEHWHRVEDGFSGRKPLLQADEGGGNLPYH